ncbi:MAG: hypothetical protein ACRDNF_18680 [Streptosporangiaceae bacterium]
MTGSIPQGHAKAPADGSADSAATGPAATATGPAASAARTAERLRQAGVGILVMLIVQYALGIGVNLFVGLPGHGGVGQAYTHGPLLAIHASLGLLLILTGIRLLIVAIRARHAAQTVLTAIGLLAIIAAAVNGALFLGNGANGSSMGMAMSTAAALFCYVISLFIAGSGPRRAADTSGRRQGER